MFNRAGFPVVCECSGEPEETGYLQGLLYRPFCQEINTYIFYCAHMHPVTLQR